MVTDTQTHRQTDRQTDRQTYIRTCLAASSQPKIRESHTIHISVQSISLANDRFQFEESVSTFTAGLYSMRPGVTTPSLVYVTFNNKIQVRGKSRLNIKDK